MAVVRCISVPGLELFWYSHEHRYEEPHFHAKKDQWEIRVFFRSCTKENGLAFNCVWPKYTSREVPSRRDRDALLARVLKNRSQLYREWEEKVQPS